MAFDKNNTPLGMKIVIVIFALILILTLCLPFFSSCSNTKTTGPTSTDEGQETQTTSGPELATVAQIDAAYSTEIASIQARLASDPQNLAAIANMGNTYMDWGIDLQSAEDAADYEEHIAATFQEAVTWYDKYLESNRSNAVVVDRACCMYYAGDPEGGLAELEAFVQENDAFSPAWANLGIFYYQDGRYAEARDAFQKGYEADAADAYGVGYYCQVYTSICESIISALEESATEMTVANGTVVEMTVENGTAVNSTVVEATEENGTVVEATVANVTVPAVPTPGNETAGNETAGNVTAGK